MGNLYVIRHGETDFNLQGRYAGSTDVELNETGIQQAMAIAERLKGYPIDIIVSSTLKRAHQTATIIQEYINKPLVSANEFVERSVGVYEGLTREEASRNHPDLWKQDVLRQFDCTSHNGESVKQVRERVNNGLQDMLYKYKNYNIVLVTHGYVAREIHRFFNNLTEEEFNQYALGNCQIAQYVID